MSAPEDDEPESAEERALVQEGLEDLDAGRFADDEDVDRELGL